MNETTWEQYIKDLNISPEYMQAYDAFLKAVEERYGDDENAKDNLAKVLTEYNLRDDYLVYGYCYCSELLYAQNVENFFDMVENNPALVKELREAVDKVARDNEKEEEKEKGPEKEEEKKQEMTNEQVLFEQSTSKEAIKDEAMTEDVVHSVTSDRYNASFEQIDELVKGNIANDKEAGVKSEELLTNEYVMEKIVTAANELGHGKNFAINESLTRQEQLNLLDDALVNFDKDLRKQINENGQLISDEDGKTLTTDQAVVNIINQNSKEVTNEEGLSPEITVEEYTATMEAISPTFAKQPYDQTMEYDYLEMQQDGYPQ